MAARTLEFAILAVARTDEVLGATWCEIDLDTKVWTIPIRIGAVAVALNPYALPHWGGASIIIDITAGKVPHNAAR